MEQETILKLPHQTADEIRVENVSICNFTCNFCPYPSDAFVRKKETMRESLYEFLMNKVKEECPQITKTCFSGMGEPFLDKNLYNKIKIARRLGFRTKVITNGSRIDADKVIDSGLDELRVSLHGINKENFKRLTGGDIDVVLANLDTLIEKGVNVLVNSVYAEEDEEDANEIIRRYADKVALLEIWRPHNWGGSTTSFRENKEPSYFCARPFVGPIVIMANGDVGTCCFDVNNTMSLGNIKDQTFEEMFQGEGTKIREAHVSRDFKGLVCENCDQIRDKKDILVFSNSNLSKEERENLQSSYLDTSTKGDKDG